MNTAKLKTPRYVPDASKLIAMRSARISKRLRALGMKIRKLATDEFSGLKVQRAADFVMSAQITTAAQACFARADIIEGVGKIKGCRA